MPTVGFSFTHQHFPHEQLHYVRRSLLKSKLLLSIALFLALMSGTRAHADAPTTRPVRLFILSGQSNMVGLKPDVSFTPAILKAFPNEECIIVHHAVGGESIRKWYKKWKP